MRYMKKGVSPFSREYKTKGQLGIHKKWSVITSSRSNKDDITMQSLLELKP